MDIKNIILWVCIVVVVSFIVIAIVHFNDWKDSRMINGKVRKRWQSIVNQFYSNLTHCEMKENSLCIRAHHIFNCTYLYDKRLDCLFVDDFQYSVIYVFSEKHNVWTPILRQTDEEDWSDPAYEEFLKRATKSYNEIQESLS